MKARAGARKGAALVLVAGGMTLLTGFAAWVVDIGAGLQARTQRQAAADSGALAAAWELGQSRSEALARAAAMDYIGRNAPGATGADVSFWRHANGEPAVSIRWTQKAETLFGQLFNAPMEVYVEASASLGGLKRVPGAVPLAVPSYVDGDQLYVLSDQPLKGPGSLLPAGLPGYVPVTFDGVDEIQLKSSQPGVPGNFRALSLGGRGASQFERNLKEGAEEAVAVGDTVLTEPGNMAGPAARGASARVGDVVPVPLISRDDWETVKGRSEVTITGFLPVRITRVDGSAIYGTPVDRVLGAQGDLNFVTLRGFRAPVLIPTPAQS